MLEQILWTEKYRPHTIQDTILPENLKTIFQQFVTNKSFPNLLLTGKGGIGKTTIAKALLDELGIEYIIINGSMDGNIDTLRNEIKNFASSVSFYGGRKVVILDEADYLNCFDGDQEIQTVDNDGNIINRKLKDLIHENNVNILSYNFNTSNIEFTESNVFQSGEKEVFEVEFEDGTKMYCTKDHPFFNNSGDEIFIQDDIELFSVNK